MGERCFILPGATEYPYEIRFRHFNPLLGRFLSFELSNDQVQVGTYVGDGAVTTTTPVEGAGGYKAVADAILYNRSWTLPVTSLTGTFSFDAALSPISGWQGNSVSGVINSPETFPNGVLFAVHGGMIVNAISTVMGTMPALSNGMTYTLSNVPGGTTLNQHPIAFYGVESIGWSTTSVAAAIPALADLSSGDATGIDMNMILLP